MSFKLVEDIPSQPGESWVFAKLIFQQRLIISRIRFVQFRKVES